MYKSLFALLAASAFVLAQDKPDSIVIADTTVPSHWKGCVQDTTVLHNGRPTQKWQLGTEHTVNLANAPKDLSTSHFITFSVYAPTDAKTGFTLYLSSQNPHSKGIDYFHVCIPITTAGWHDYSFNLRELIPVRIPRGLDQIDFINITASGWGFVPDPNVTLYLSDVRLEGKLPPVRRRMVDFLDTFDWSYPGLELAAQAWKNHDEEAAVNALADYFRNRRNVIWNFDPHNPDLKFKYNKKAADDTCEGKVTVVCVDYQYPNGDFDWMYNHTFADPKLPDNYEWQWQLNRMSFWYELGRTYRMTKDEKYAQAFVKQLRSWIKQCPDPIYHSGNHGTSAWRTIECGIRLLGSWPEAFFLFLHSPTFTNQDLLLMVKAMYEQMEHLMAYPQRGNWLTMEMNGVYTFAALFPEFKSSKDARKFAFNKLYNDIEEQILPDGAQFELTPGYHGVALGNFMGLPGTAIRMHLESEIPTNYLKRLEKAFNYQLQLMTPDRNLPKFNDSWGVNVVREMQKASKSFPDRKDFAWVASNGQNGEAPATTSLFLPYAGYAVMRSSWERNANYLAFDFGPLGNGHVHQDKLNLVIYSGARELIFDDGGGCYEHSPFRSYATSAFGHNTILVDGKPQYRNPGDMANKFTRTPLDCNWSSTPERDFAAGTYADGFGKADNRIATHTRQVLFLKPDLFLVADILTPNDQAEHNYQLRWQVNSTKTAPFLPNHPALVSVTDKQPDVVVAPLLTNGLEVKAVSKQTEPELLGWYVIKDAGPYRPATTVLMSRKGTGTQLFLTAFMPVPEQATPQITAISQTAPATATITLANGKTLVVSAPASTDQKLEVTQK